MYKGNNKIALQSQQMIADAFMKQLKDKPFHKISISEICNEAMVSRQTFYSLFDSKENILYYEYEKHALDFSDYFIDESVVTIRKLVHVFIEYISQYDELFTILVNNNLTEILGNGIKNSLLSCEKLSFSTEDLKNDYAISFISGALIEITNKYIKNGKVDDLDMIEQLLVELFEGKYLSAYSEKSNY